MRIAFYAPFKPLDHPSPSGDRTIGRGLLRFLSRNHEVVTASTLRARWIYWRPWLWPKLALERTAAVRRAQEADLWLSYHIYYKAPDLLGPYCAKRLGVPYCVFQGIYSTKRRRQWRARPGFVLNRRSLKGAEVVFTNKRVDHENLRRIIPEERLHYVPPGIYPEDFPRDTTRREELRAGLAGSPDLENSPVILTAAMFRDDVKTRGLTFLMRALAPLAKQGKAFRLAIAGDGVTRARLEKLADETLPGKVTFLGLVERRTLHHWYSAADLFAFPGIRESLGMVYLEAQCCGLPVVAFDGWGIPEVVVKGETALLTEPFDEAAFGGAVATLLDDAERREAMGRAAMHHVREVHDLNRNYQRVEDILAEVVRNHRERAS